jgi:hypothetical protein
LRHLDREFGAVGFRKPRLILEAWRDRAIADCVRVAELIELEQSRGYRLASVVSLTSLRIDDNLKECVLGHT